jgi:hypothetical protein
MAEEGETHSSFRAEPATLDCTSPAGAVGLAAQGLRPRTAEHEGRCRLVVLEPAKFVTKAVSAPTKNENRCPPAPAPTHTTVTDQTKRIGGSFRVAIVRINPENGTATRHTWFENRMKPAQQTEMMTAGVRGRDMGETRFKTHFMGR